jgi:isoquinoline 1-oxidoreductase alpha subunit
VTPIGSIGAAKVRTIEALHDTEVGRALQRAWRELEVPQCGYCQSGQLMSAAVLLETSRAPSDAQIDAVMAGNLCRCGTYGRIRAGIKLAATFLSDASR